MQRSNWVSRVTPSRGWDRVFLLMALARDLPLWRIAGLPQELSRAPAAALSAGREFLVQVRGENDADRHAAAAARALTRLEDEYGPEVAAGVESFARRHFVRPKPFDVIDAWAGFLPTLTRRDRAPLPVEALRIAPDRKQRLLDSLGELMTAHYDELGRREAEAVSLPLSPVEEDIIRYEVTVPIDGYTPGLDEAAIAANREMTFAVWRRLGELLEEQEISQFVRWARELAPSVRVDPTGLNRPT